MFAFVSLFVWLCFRRTLVDVVLVLLRVNVRGDWFTISHFASVLTALPNRLFKPHASVSGAGADGPCDFVLQRHVRVKAYTWCSRSRRWSALFCDTLCLQVFLLVVGLTEHRFLLARLPSGALVQCCSLCCVFRVGVVDVSPLRRRMDVVVSARGTCLVHVGILQLVARQSRGLLHMVCLSVPPKRGFFLCDCVFYSLKSTTTDIGFESTFAAAMLCFIHDDLCFLSVAWLFTRLVVGQPFFLPRRLCEHRLHS